MIRTTAETMSSSEAACDRDAGEQRQRHDRRHHRHHCDNLWLKPNQAERMICPSRRRSPLCKYNAADRAQLSSAPSTSRQVDIYPGEAGTCRRPRYLFPPSDACTPTARDGRQLAGDPRPANRRRWPGGEPGLRRPASGAAAERGRRYLLSGRSGCQSTRRRGARRLRRGRNHRIGPACLRQRAIGDPPDRAGPCGARYRCAGVRKLLGPAASYRRRRRQRPQESEGPGNRLRPRHHADRRWAQAPDVRGQAQRLQRADRASRRGRDAGARHDSARDQPGVRGPERRNPLQRRGRMGRAVPPGISAARGRGHRASHRAAPDRRGLLPQRAGHRSVRGRPRLARPQPGRQALGMALRHQPGTCSTRSCAPARSRTGWNSRCCPTAPAADGAERDKLRHSGTEAKKIKRSCTPRRSRSDSPASAVSTDRRDRGSTGNST